MHLYAWLLCRIMATGDIFNFFGILFLRESQVTTRAKPFETFSAVLSSRHCSASGFLMGALCTAELGAGGLVTSLGCS